MYNVILCGGSGTRLWPLSRAKMPKQFLKLFDDRSLFQLTLQRNAPFIKKFIAITNQEHYFLLQDQYEELALDRTLQSIIEPFGKNTAPAIAFAAMMVDPQEILFVTPSDHLIQADEHYREAFQRAKELALQDYLVTFGIDPTYPETGYGYIEAEGEKVLSFREKPDLHTAKNYLNAQRYYWNSGMFMFKAGRYLEELERHAPAIYESALQAFDDAKSVGEDLRLSEESMAEVVEDSIDYAVMERSQAIRVVPSQFQWSDVGSFDALAQILPSSEHLSIDAKENFVHADKKVVLIDVEDLVVVDTSDALLVTKKGSSQKVKEAVKRLQEEGAKEILFHNEVHRPWGTYEVLIDEEGYKLKRIVVKPGKRLSLQKHFHRNEHWIVVSGTAQVQVGDRTYLVRPNESTYIKMGEVHRLSNPGKIPVVLIEAQVGEYTGEDDIVRLEDDYRRV